MGLFLISPHIRLPSSLLQPVAVGMGLNLQKEKLWRDKALVEMNVAILHSFQVGVAPRWVGSHDPVYMLK